MSLNNTPSAERLHIGIFGKRNAGKSSVINAMTGQNLAIVSDVAGTTTDPVQKAMELLPLGPVVMIDTPGLDDVGELGKMRVEKAYQVLQKTDIAVIVIDASVGETAEDAAILAEIQKKISEAEIIEVLKQFDLYEDRNKKVGKYSVGMKQKLRLAQAVMEKPQVLILDEPMNGLDKKSVKKVEDILKAFVENGGTLLMTSHIEQQVEACCKIVYEIDGGEILRVTVLQ